MWKNMVGLAATPAFLLSGCAPGDRDALKARAEQDRTIALQAARITELEAAVESHRTGRIRDALTDYSERTSALNDRLRADLAEVESERLAGDAAERRRQDAADAVVRASGSKPLSDF